MKRLATLMTALVILAPPLVAQEMRTVTDDLGNTVEIPVHPKRIVVTRSDCMATPLIELGAPLVGAGSMQDDGFNNGRPFIRGATALYGTQFDDDLADIGFINEPDLEAVAATEPDLILIASWTADSYENLSKIAPTYAAACFDPVLTDWLATLADRIDNPADVSMVFADPFEDGIYVADAYGTFTVVADALGFDRITSDDLGMIDDDGYLSFELVQEIDTDFIFSSHQSFFGQPPSQRKALWDAKVPGFDTLLHAPRNNQFVILDRSLVRAFAVDGLEAMLNVMVSHVAERDFVPRDGG